MSRSLRFLGMTSVVRSATRPLTALHDREDVALGVLEPRGLGAATRRDAVLGLESGHVVLLERYAALFQPRDFGLDVIHLPERLTGLGRSGVRGRVQEASRFVSELVDDAAGSLHCRLESELALIELACARDVFRGQVRVHRGCLQHEISRWSYASKCDIIGLRRSYGRPVVPSKEPVPTARPSAQPVDAGLQISGSHTNRSTQPQ